MSKKRTPLRIAVDTREQQPFRYKGSIRKALKSGDYSIVGMEERVAIERKRVKELFSCAGKDRKRFERELVRLAAFDYAAIVIEGPLSALLEPSMFSRLKPSIVINSLLSWAVKYRIGVFFCDTRRLARAVTYHLLEKFLKHHGGPYGRK